ncbi:kinase-like domain-containing protein [Mycena epipterygia]|nr:kinase-like domain-containing protein [Mycena epipterygia]
MVLLLIIRVSADLLSVVGLESSDNADTAAEDEDILSASYSSEEKYEGWVARAISPLSRFIDAAVNPRHHYLDLQEIGDGRGDTTLYVAQLSENRRDDLTLPNHVKERDQSDLLARRQTYVAIKSVPIVPSGSPKLLEVLSELSTMRDIQCDNILGMDALYIDPEEDTLWIRMELMTRTLSSVIDLNAAGLVLPDRTIAGCTKDILSALEHLRINDISPRNIRSENVLINHHGVLKLTNLSNAVKVSSGFPAQVSAPSSTKITSDASALGALVWELAAGVRPPSDSRSSGADWPSLSSATSRTPAFHEFIQLCFEFVVGNIGYRPLIESAFIRDACERPTLAQLLVQCTVFEGRLREQRRAR